MRQDSDKGGKTGVFLKANCLHLVPHILIQEFPKVGGQCCKPQCVSLPAVVLCPTAH